MSIESAVYAALKGLVPKPAPNASQGRVYPDVNDDHAGIVLPYIVYQRVGGEAPNFLENAVPDKENARLQVTSWHTTRLGAKTLCDQVLAALVALGWRPIGAPVSLYDPATKYRGSAQDFNAWADR